MAVFNIHEAKTQFSRLVGDAAAGREVVIAKAGKPIAKLVPIGDEVPSRKPPRELGLLAGKYNIPEDFYEPLPDAVLATFEYPLPGLNDVSPAHRIDLTDHQHKLIESSVASGRYGNASEVVRDGLRLLEQQQEEYTAKLERLRGEARIGFDALTNHDFVEVSEGGLRDLVADLGRAGGRR